MLVKEQSLTTILGRRPAADWTQWAMDRPTGFMYCRTCLWKICGAEVEGCSKLTSPAGDFRCTSWIRWCHLPIRPMRPWYLVWWPWKMWLGHQHQPCWPPRAETGKVLVRTIAGVHKHAPPPPITDLASSGILQLGRKNDYPWRQHMPFQLEASADQDCFRRSIQSGSWGIAAWAYDLRSNFN